MQKSLSDKSCCFTGHRMLPFDKKELIRKKLAQVVEELIGEGYGCFVSGGAVGFDLMAAETVLEKKKEFPEIRLVMALPCRDQHKKWGRAEQDRYEKVLGCADEVVYLCESYVTGCMHLRNRYMVERCDLCITYMERPGGGTGFTVSYAVEKGRRVINLAYIV